MVCLIQGPYSICPDKSEDNAQSLVLVSVDRLHQGCNDFFGIPKRCVRLQSCNAFLNGLFCVPGQEEKFYSRTVPGAVLFAPDEDTTLVSADSVPKPDKTGLEMSY